MLYLKKDSLQTRKALQSGLVLVSTGVWKLEKPSVAGHYVKSSTLKLNADNTELAYAA